MGVSVARVAVTGANGFLGSRVVAALRSGAIPVRAVARSAEKAAACAAPGVETAVAELLEPDTLARAFEGCDGVVACAAFTSKHAGDLDRFLAVNRAGTENVLRAAASAGARRVVYVSTTAVYRTRLYRTITEEAPLLGKGADWSWMVTDWRYAKSKALAEEHLWTCAAELGLEVTALRPGPIYGRGACRTTWGYLRALDRRVAFAPTVRVPHVHVDDVAAACVAALGAPGAGRAYNVTGEAVSPYDVLRALVRHRGHGPTLVPVPLPVWLDYDDSAAMRDLGFHSRPIRDGILDILSPG